MAPRIHQLEPVAADNTPPFDLRKDRSALSDKSGQNLLWDIFSGTVGTMFGTYSISFVF